MDKTLIFIAIDDILEDISNIEEIITIMNIIN